MKNIIVYDVKIINKQNIFNSCYLLLLHLSLNSASQNIRNYRFKVRQRKNEKYGVSYKVVIDVYIFFYCNKITFHPSFPQNKPETKQNVCMNLIMY